MTLGYKTSNMRFLNGHIEYLDQAGIADGSIDLIISNCVINLSPDKEQVLREAYRVLAAGGEMYFSDVYSDRRVPEEAKKNEVCSNISCSCIPFTCRCSLNHACPWSFATEVGSYQHELIFDVGMYNPCTSLALVWSNHTQACSY